MSHDLSSGSETKGGQSGRYYPGNPPLRDKILRIQGGGFLDPLSGAQIFGFRDAFWTVLPLEIARLRVRKPIFFWSPEAAGKFSHL